jgi:GTP-binding protein
MQIQQAEFIKSHQSLESFGESQRAEFAFVGRSNVGKSSLINMIVGGKNDLAIVSARPGRTQMINEFLINKTWNLIDLPGYGFAKTSKAQQDKFHTIVSDYLLRRENITCVFALIDSKIPPQQLDLRFTEWLMDCEIPFILVFTKADKSKPGASLRNIEQFYEGMAEFCEGPPRYILTSAETRQGRKELLDFIDAALKSHESVRK